MSKGTQLSRSIPFPVRFGLQVVRQANGCWIWQGGKNSKGYGHIERRGQRIQAHHASWELHRGPVPQGLWVLHACDVPSCVNPAHLFVGTPTDNSQDCLKKGRWGKNEVKGEQVGTSKLNAEQVLAIRSLAKVRSVKDIASIYSVKASTIYDVLQGRTWAHVKEAV